MVNNFRKRWTKRGDQMGMCDLEDLYGALEVTMFPKALEQHGHKVEDDVVVVMEGRLDRRDEEPKLLCYQVDQVRLDWVNGLGPLKVNLNGRNLTAERVEALKSVIAGHPGKSEVILMVGDDQGIKLPAAYGVDAGSGLIGELREMLGENAIAV